MQQKVVSMKSAAWLSQTGRMKLGYARVSSGEQDLDLQRDSLRAAGFSMIHKNESVSGVARRRPELDQTLASLKQGDTLVTWRLDRLAASCPT